MRTSVLTYVRIVFLQGRSPGTDLWKAAGVMITMVIMMYDDNVCMMMTMYDDDDV